MVQKTVETHGRTDGHDRFYDAAGNGNAVSRVNNGSMGHGLMGEMGQWVSFLDGSYGSWVDALSPMTHLHFYQKHVVKATFVVGDN